MEGGISAWRTGSLSFVHAAADYWITIHTTKKEGMS